MKRQKPSKKFVIGLTGSFGTGKTTAARMLREEGAYVIDADAISRALTRPKTPLSRRILAAFGKGVERKDGSIDRAKLAGVVFASPAARRKLERIVHPRVIREIRRTIRQAKKKIIVLDAPLLLEAKLEHLVDKVVVVSATQKNQIKRIHEHLGLSRPHILSRIRSQMPLEKKVRMADFIIDNNATLTCLRKQVTELRRMWWRS